MATKRRRTRKKALYGGEAYKGLKRIDVVLTPVELKRANQRSKKYFAGKLAKTHKMILK